MATRSLKMIYLNILKYRASLLVRIDLTVLSNDDISSRYTLRTYETINFQLQSIFPRDILTT